MAFNEIPKIRWREVTVEGDSTTSNDTITGITSTADLREGMFIDHPDFPVGTKIIDIPDAVSVQLSNAATGTSANEDFDFYHQITFNYPPEDDDGEAYNSKERVSTSISGDRQISSDHVEAKRDLTFSFLSKAEVDELRFFWTDWAYIGNAFKYFENKNSVTFIEYEKDGNSFDPSKVTPVKYKVKFKFRRVL